MKILKPTTMNNRIGFILLTDFTECVFANIRPSFRAYKLVTTVNEHVYFRDFRYAAGD